MYSGANYKVRFYLKVHVLVMLYSSSCGLEDRKNKPYNNGLAYTIKKSYPIFDCIDTQHQAYLGNIDNVDGTRNGDTITWVDAVVKQYLSLPFPPVPMEDLTREKQHYIDGIKKLPYEAYPTIDLEYLNHFLYKGGNDFM